MASFNGNIDLLSLNGSQVFTGIDKNKPQRAYVCIPVDLNEIKVESAPNNAQRMLAKLHVNIWPLNEQYKAKVRQSALERGDTNVSVPTHEMQVSFTTEYIKLAIDTFPKLVEQVKEANKERNPDIVNQNPKDETTHLFKAIRSRMNKRLAMLYQPLSTTQPQGAYQAPSYAQAGAAAAYTPPTENTDPLAGYTDINEDDLPF